MCVCVCARICFLGGLPPPRPRIGSGISLGLARHLGVLFVGDRTTSRRQVGKSKHRIERKWTMPNESARKLTKTNEAGSRLVESDENGRKRMKMHEN